MSHFGKTLTALIAAVVIASPTVTPAAEVANRDLISNRIKEAPAHPRLFWTGADEAGIKSKLAQASQLTGVWDAVRITADHMLKEAPVVYRKDGRRLLGRSREALGRTIHLGFAFRMTGDKRYSDRVMAEMRAMAAMQDWNPSHFLDTAEMTLAMAVGYDWVYNQIPPELRKTCRDAIVTKGLNPYLKAAKPHGWERGGNNWNQVCHAGMVGGSLALLEDDPDRATEVVSRALAGLPSAMKVYDPDGTYPEGPGYWNYGTSFNVMLISMLESVLGSDFGLSQSPGFLKSGEFMLNIIGPTMQTYPFSDCGTGTGFSPAMTWFAARAERPELMWFENDLLERELTGIRESGGKKQGDRYFPLVLIWAKAGIERKEPAALNWLGVGPNPIAVLRTSWKDSNAVFVGIKAGTPSASHAHLDIGSFILDAHGMRWSLDLGSQEYNALELQGFDLWGNRQGAQRWSLFRYHNRGHSTLVVDGQEQIIASKAPIANFSGDPKNSYAVVDLSATYAGQLGAAVRKFTLQPDHQVIIEDQLTGGAKSATVRWGMVTPATLKPTGDSAGWLEQGGKRLRLEVLSPAGVKLKGWSADELANTRYDNRNPGISVVGFHVPVKAGENVTLKVALRP